MARRARPTSSWSSTIRPRTRSTSRAGSSSTSPRPARASATTRPCRRAPRSRRMGSTCSPIPTTPAPRPPIGPGARPVSPTTATSASWTRQRSRSTAWAGAARTLPRAAWRRPGPPPRPAPSARPAPDQLRPRSGRGAQSSSRATVRTRTTTATISSCRPTAATRRTPEARPSRRSQRAETGPAAGARRPRRCTRATSSLLLRSRSRRIQLTRSPACRSWSLRPGPGRIRWVTSRCRARGSRARQPRS